jgi:hypothetical protein
LSQADFAPLDLQILRFLQRQGSGQRNRPGIEEKRKAPAQKVT